MVYSLGDTVFLGKGKDKMFEKAVNKRLDEQQGVVYSGGLKLGIVIGFVTGVFIASIFYAI